jgi:alkylation response protein AidB-like acyl-CoA dehydrogenase
MWAAPYERAARKTPERGTTARDLIDIGLSNCDVAVRLQHFRKETHPITGCGSALLDVYSGYSGGQMGTQAARSMTTDTEKLLEAVRQIEPVIRDHSEQAERERRLSKQALEAMTEAGLFRMFTPRSLGGLEMSPLNCARVVEEVSGFDSAAGWSLFNPLSWAFFCARLPDEGAEEIFARHPNALIAGPFHPPMQAVPVDNGYSVSGRSPFASNCHDATWIGSTAVIMEDGKPKMTASGSPEVIGVFYGADECEILDTWHVLGMRGTGSNDIFVTNTFVPTTRTFALTAEFEPGTHYKGSLYRFSLMGDVAATFAPIVLAIARNAINEVSSIAHRKTPFGSTTLLRERITAQVKLAEAEAVLRSARALLYDTLNECWEQTLAGESPSLTQRADLLLATVNANTSAGKVAQLVYSVAGTSGIYMRNPLERHFRDLQVLRQHGFASESRYEAVGQVYLGIAPEWAPIVL